MARSARTTERLGGTSGPHAFVEPDDNRLGLAMSAVRAPGTGMAQSLAVTDASLRGHRARCAMAGCGKAREDPIHLPAD
jgi:hypothetical protein